MWATTLDGAPLVDELTFRHHEVMGLVVCALDHDAHEPKSLELRGLARIASGDDELDPIRQILSAGAPPEPNQLAGMRRNHALDCTERAALALNGDFNAVVEGP